MFNLLPNIDVKISAKALKADGTEVDISTDELVLELVDVSGNAGTLNDANDTLTTGSDGSATVNGSVNVDGTSFTATASYNILNDGTGIDHIELAFNPVV